jgi:hypothetical protein
MFGSEIVPFQGKGMGKVCRYVSSCNETSNSSGTRSLGLWGERSGQFGVEASVYKKRERNGQRTMHGL